MEKERMKLFYSKTMPVNGTRPDHVTFLSVLSSYVHAGSIKIGNKLFNATLYGDANFSLDHYTLNVPQVFSLN